MWVPMRPGETMAQHSSKSAPVIALRRPERLSPLVSLGLRGLIVLALLAVAVLGHWIDRDGLKDNIDGHISFLDIIYFTAITITTVGYGDIVPVTETARMFDTLVLTPIRLFVWLIFLGTAYDFVFRRLWDRWQMQSIQAELRGHHIVCGYGSSGEAAVGELRRGGVPPLEIVVIDGDAARVEAAIAGGVTAMQGDATHNAVLQAAQVARAHAVLVCTGRDDTSALVVLSARQLSPATHVSVIVKATENEGLIRQAGADAVVNPVDLGGQLLARAADSRRVVDYVADLVTNDGRVCLQERPVTAAEVGTSLRDLATGLGVRIHRGRRVIGFWEAEPLAAGDVVVEIVARVG